MQIEIRRFAFAIVTLLSAGLLFAQTPAQKSFTLEQVLSSPFPAGLTTASNSSRIAWVFNAKGVPNVWIADAPKFDAKQVTHYNADEGLPIASLRLTPDGKTVVFARGTEANGSGEIADPTSNVQKRAQQVWAVKVDQGEPQLLGDMGCEEEGCEDIQVSPNGEFAVWSAKKQLWIAPISGSEKAHALTYARGNNSQPKWSPDGKKIAFVSNRGDHSFVAIYQFGRETLQYVLPTPDRDISSALVTGWKPARLCPCSGEATETTDPSTNTGTCGRSGFTTWPLTKALKCGIAETHSTIPFLVLPPMFLSNSREKIDWCLHPKKTDGIICTQSQLEAAMPFCSRREILRPRMLRSAPTRTR